ncbi:MAG: 2-O-methyltransferase NoeI [Cyanobacteriota bacterium]|jgi:FkbM family methyltransferase
MKKNTVRKLLQKDNPVVLEIGASTGEDTLEFLGEFSHIQLYCFEPDPRCQEIHKSKVNDPRCQLYEIAISDVNGEAEFYQSNGSYEGFSEYQDWLQSSSLKKPKNHLEVHPWCKFENKVTVPTRRLDSWFEENQIDEIDLIWADVQGAEENLIKGGLKTLSHTKYFYTEYEDDELYEGQITLEQIKTLLPNFKAIGYFGNNVLFKNTEMPASVFNNAEPIAWQTWDIFPPKVWLQLHKRKLKSKVKSLISATT